MRLRLGTSSGVPIYRQIVDQIADLVAAGRLNVGDRLPSVRELARSLPVNQNTVIKAYELLERDGLITRKHGDGTFVARRGPTMPLAQRRRLVAEQLGAAVSKGLLFQLAPADLHALLDEQINKLSPKREDDHA